MKVKEFFSKREKQAKIDNEAFKKFMESLDKVELEIPDDVEALLEEAFLTRERAGSDSKIMGKARAEAYDAMDERITKMIPLIKSIDGNLVIDIETEKDTLRKITKLGEALGKASDKFKSAGGQDTEKVKEYEKQVNDLLEKIKVINQERETEKTSIAEKFDNEKKDLVLNYALRDKINSIEFADEHKPLRDSLTRVILEDVKKDSHLSLNESGQIVVSVLENGVPKPKFNGNSPVTFESVLEEKTKPYIKRNNAGGNGNGGGNPPAPRPEPPRQQPHSGGLTLKEMQRQASAG
jgi:hypothetical protein